MTNALSARKRLREKAGALLYRKNSGTLWENLEFITSVSLVKHYRQASKFFLLECKRLEGKKKAEIAK